MLLSIITLNYKKPELTLACIKSLQDVYKEAFQSEKFEIIVVDNDSQDASVEKIKEAIKKEDYRNTHLIANSENGGFAKGCNLGAAKAKGKYLLFINNDTIVGDKGILSMANYLEDHEEVSILGGQLRNSDGSLQQSTEKFYTPFRAVFFLLGVQKVASGFNKVTEVDWVKGGLLMIKKDVFEKLDGFDEKIFMYIEDMELCYRAKQKGYKTFFYPDIQIVHKEHGSASRTFAIVNIYKNLLYFYKKHRSNEEYQFIHLFMVAKAVFLIAIGRVLRNNYLIQTYEQALKAI